MYGSAHRKVCTNTRQHNIDKSEHASSNPAALKPLVPVVTCSKTTQALYVI
jgi:hypothetical protein